MKVVQVGTFGSWSWLIYNEKMTCHIFLFTADKTKRFYTQFSVKNGAC
jgi:hypothetical protein